MKAKYLWNRSLAVYDPQYLQPARRNAGGKADPDFLATYPEDFETKCNGPCKRF